MKASVRKHIHKSRALLSCRACNALIKIMAYDDPLWMLLRNIFIPCLLVLHSIDLCFVFSGNTAINCYPTGSVQNIAHRRSPPFNYKLPDKLRMLERIWSRHCDTSGCQ